MNIPAKFLIYTTCLFMSTTTAVIGGPLLPEDNSGRTLRFSLYETALGTTEDGTLDPLRTYQILYFNLQHQIFECLVAVDFNTQNIVPVLAESWELLNDRKVRFHLRHGIRFHNGERFTADAVKFSLDLMKDPRNKFAGRFLLETVVSAHVIDDYTVDIILNTRDVLLLRKLSCIGFIFPPVYYRRVGDAYFTSHPMGTGPFRFFYNTVEESSIKEIHLVANEDYWGTAPAIKELVYRAMPHEVHWKALKRNDVNLLITQDSTNRPLVADNDAFTCFTRKSLRASFCLLNRDKKGPLAKLLVRRALQHGVNRTEIIRQALDGYGFPLYVPSPEGALAHVSNKPVYAESRQKALDLLARAGCKDGLTLKVMASKNKPTAAVVDILKKQFADIRVSLDVTFMSRQELFDEIIFPKLQGIAHPSTYDMWVITGWPSMFGSGAHFDFVFLHSQGMFNFGIYMGEGSAVDRQYKKVVESADKSDLKRNLENLDRLTMEESLVIPLYQVETLYGMDRNLHFDPGLNDIPLRFKHAVFK